MLHAHGSLPSLVLCIGYQFFSPITGLFGQYIFVPRSVTLRAGSREMSMQFSTFAEGWHRLQPHPALQLLRKEFSFRPDYTSHYGYDSAS